MQEAMGLDAVKKTDRQGEKTDSEGSDLDQVKGMLSLKGDSVAGPPKVGKKWHAQLNNK